MRRKKKHHSNRDFIPVSFWNVCGAITFDKVELFVIVEVVSEWNDCTERAIVQSFVKTVKCNR